MHVTLWNRLMYLLKLEAMISVKHKKHRILLQIIHLLDLLLVKLLYG